MMLIKSKETLMGFKQQNHAAIMTINATIRMNHTNPLFSECHFLMNSLSFIWPSYNFSISYVLRPQKSNVFGGNASVLKFAFCDVTNDTSSALLALAEIRMSPMSQSDSQVCKYWPLTAS